uniref:DM2 domain-containing protein n=1 Tax=viral metagenome TaxID=1070528 RepID=A0A6C0ERY0_9ZZZZ
MSSSSTPVKSKMPAKKSAPVAPAPAPVAETPKPAKAAKAAKPAKAAVPSKAVVTVPTVETPSAPAVVESAESSDVILASLAEKLKALSTELTTRVREATKSVSDAIKATKREAREIKKKKKKNPEDMTPEERKTWEARRANNAFLVQRPLTDELCHFMGLKSGEKRSQTEVTKFISNYVKEHSCFDPAFKRRILPNSALAKLLRVSDKDEVTYLNLQSFLKVHFIKPKA